MGGLALVDGMAWGFRLATAETGRLRRGGSAGFDLLAVLATRTVRLLSFAAGRDFGGSVVAAHGPRLVVATGDPNVGDLG